MANKRIQDLPAKGATIAANDILEVSEYQSPGVYTSKKILGSELGGVTSFEDLTDTFTFAGNELETVRVNAAGTALETYTPATVSTGRFGIADSNGAYTYYTTLTLAMTAATSGQTIEFFTDYTETGAVTITLKDGVTINGNGHTYTLSVANDTNHSLLVDTSGTFRIYNLNVRRTGGGTSAQCLRATSANCSIYGDGSFFYASNSEAIRATSATSNIYNCTASSDNASSYCILAEGNIYNSLGKGVANGIGNYGGRVYNSTGESTNGIGLDVTCAYNSTGISSANYGIQCPSGGGIGQLYNCQGYSSASYGIRNNKVGAYFYQCSGFSTGSIGFGATSATLNACGAYSSTQWGIYSVNNNGINNTTSFSSTNYGAYLEGAGLLKNCTIESNSSSAVFIASSLVEVTNCTLTTNDAADYCLHATSAITAKYANNAFKGATTPVHANITQGVVNTHDSQGNILI